VERKNAGGTPVLPVSLAVLTSKQTDLRRGFVDCIVSTLSGSFALLRMTDFTLVELREYRADDEPLAGNVG